MGIAECRFADCGLSLGCADMSDGCWVWPQGFEHYITVHGISLPE